jgi:hypothetical protein
MKPALIPLSSMQEDDFRLERIEAELGSSRQRVEHLATLETERAAAFEASTSRASVVGTEVARLKSFFEDSNRPIEGIEGGFARFQRDVNELKVWNQFLRFSGAAGSSNPGLAAFLSRGSAGQQVSFEK